MSNKEYKKDNVVKFKEPKELIIEGVRTPINYRDLCWVITSINADEVKGKTEPFHPPHFNQASSWVDSNPISVENIIPIELTDAILKKIGFVRTQVNTPQDIEYRYPSNYQGNNNVQQFIIHKNDNGYWYSDIDPIYIEYLHELQNLYEEKRRTPLPINFNDIKGVI